MTRLLYVEKRRKPWSKWRPFPDPKNKGILVAPIGPGVYQLRNRKTKKFVLFGKSKNVALRMTSLLPAPWGGGERTNLKKRRYVNRNLSFIEYRTKACDSEDEASAEEENVRNEQTYLFPT